MGLTEASAFKDGKIVNDDVNASAAIAGTKINPDFGNQDITTDADNIFINNNNAVLFFGTDTGGFGANAGIGIAQQSQYHISGSAAGDLCIAAKTGKSIRFGTRASGSGVIYTQMRIQPSGTLEVRQNIDFINQKEFKFFDNDNSHSISFKAPATIASDLVFTLPTTDAAFSGYALISDGAGTLSWGVAGGASGSGNNQVFWENDQTVTANYTITNNKNAGSFGPITINSGVVVTIGSGQTWSIV
tara:strand:- start:853 stop:1587 length:735 start_codon:yes stop_codon:yes gene_type:complete